MNCKNCNHEIRKYEGKWWHYREIPIVLREEKDFIPIITTLEFKRKCLSCESKGRILDKIKCWFIPCQCKKAEPYLYEGTAPAEEPEKKSIEWKVEVI